VSTVDRNFPANVRQMFGAIEQDALIAFYRELYQESINSFRQVLEIVIREQRRSNRAFHKGSIYYYMGRALIGIDDNLEAVRNILYAYVEDVLNQPLNLEDNADRTPAAVFLRDGFIIQLRLLGGIKTVSRRVKESSQSWLHAFDPEPLLNEALSRMNVAPANILSLCERQNLRIGPVALGFPQPRGRRVFIGTNYDSHAHLIPEMRIAVMMRNYIPVLTRDVVVPQNTNVHDVSLVLLHTCGWAVFDVTNPAGQVMEIERARDYGVNVLLVRSDPASHPPHVSQMISSLGYRLETYRDVNVLRQVIGNFLPP